MFCDSEVLKDVPLIACAVFAIAAELVFTMPMEVSTPELRVPVGDIEAGGEAVVEVTLTATSSARLFSNYNWSVRCGYACAL